MKKTILLLLWISICAQSIFAQFDCSDGRFDNTSYFPAFTLDEGVTYGENVQPTIFNPNNIQTLKMDIYEPDNDTASLRPLIIWAFGGAFVAGSRKSPDIVVLATTFAQSGYVCASIDYRLSTNLILNGNPTNGYRAVFKAMEDMKAAIRFLRKDIIENGNPYRIHPDHIYVGGVSAGAFTALHTAYLDEDSEIPAEIADEVANNGGLEGLSGTPGYSSEVNGVINLCGALGDTTYMQMGDVPLVSMHGTEDETVPYGSDIIDLLNINLPVDGSASIHERGLNLGLNSEFYTWQNAGHTPFVSSPAYMDTTIRFVKDFMLDLVCDFNTVSVVEKSSSAWQLQVNPNPADEGFMVSMSNAPSGTRWTYELLNLNGQVLRQYQSEDSSFYVARENLSAGLYLLSVRSPEEQVVRKVVFR